MPHHLMGIERGFNEKRDTIGTRVVTGAFWKTSNFDSRRRKCRIN